MHNALKHIVEKTVAASQLTEKQKAQLRNELLDHVTEHTRELELQGCSEEQVITEITSAFGSTKEIGKQLYLVHHRFERIPWIGPLFYYHPVVLGMRLTICHILILIVSIGLFPAFLVPLTLYGPPVVERIAEALMNMFGPLLLGVPLVLLEGAWLAQRARIRLLLQSAALSFVPFLLIPYVKFLNLFFNQELWGVHIRGVLLWLYGIAMYACILFCGVMLYKGYTYTRYSYQKTRHRTQPL